ncbi:MAG TPA: ATP-binding protein, partial [Solirubrobacteraceae bacterium]|nr:ATP-binding protein [Solirubrobacteraceae bacterium]
LAAALSDLVATLRAAGIEVTLEVPEDADLPAATEALFYRIAQEAIRNARRHAEPSHVDIELADVDSAARFSIKDDGRGFSSASAPGDQEQRHFGLRLMRDLVDHAGGRLEVISAPGEGTCITVWMP